MKNINNKLMDAIATYMDNDIREELHFKFAPCSPKKFLQEYIKRDHGFVQVLESEFSIAL